MARWQDAPIVDQAEQSNQEQAKPRPRWMDAPVVAQPAATQNPQPAATPRWQQAPVVNATSASPAAPATAPAPTAPRPRWMDAPVVEPASPSTEPRQGPAVTPGTALAENPKPDRIDYLRDRIMRSASPGIRDMQQRDKAESAAIKKAKSTDGPVDLPPASAFDAPGEVRAIGQADEFGQRDNTPNQRAILLAMEDVAPQRFRADERGRAVNRLERIRRTDLPRYIELVTEATDQINERRPAGNKMMNPAVDELYLLTKARDEGIEFDVDAEGFDIEQLAIDLRNVQKDKELAEMSVLDRAQFLVDRAGQSAIDTVDLGIQGLQRLGESQTGLSYNPGTDLLRAGLLTPLVGDETSREARAAELAQNPLAGGRSDRLSQALGSTLPFLVTGGVGAGVGLPASLSAAAAGSAVKAGELYNEAREMGATEQEARDAMYMGALIGTTEGLPIGRALDRAGDTLKLARRADQVTRGGLSRRLLRLGEAGIKGAAEEASQEALDNILSNAVARRFYDQNRDLVDGLLESVEAGGFAGFVMNTVASLVGGVAGRRQRVSEQSLQQETENAENQTNEQAQEERPAPQAVGGGADGDGQVRPVDAGSTSDGAAGGGDVGLDAPNQGNSVQPGDEAVPEAEADGRARDAGGRLETALPEPTRFGLTPEDMARANRVRPLADLPLAEAEAVAYGVKRFWEEKDGVDAPAGMMAADHRVAKTARAAAEGLGREAIEGRVETNAESLAENSGGNAGVPFNDAGDVQHERGGHRRNAGVGEAGKDGTNGISREIQQAATLGSDAGGSKEGSLATSRYELGDVNRSGRVDLLNPELVPLGNLENKIGDPTLRRERPRAGEEASGANRQGLGGESPSALGQSGATGDRRSDAIKIAPAAPDSDLDAMAERARDAFRAKTGREDFDLHRVEATGKIINEATRFTQSLGVDPIWVQSSSGSQYGGTHSVGTNKILVDVRRPERAVVGVVAHEFAHELESSSPDIWQQMADYIREEASPALAAYSEQYAAALDAAGGNGNRIRNNPDLALKEGVSVFLEDNITDIRFWQQMSRRRPSLIRRAFDFFERLYLRLVKNTTPELRNRIRFVQDVKDLINRRNAMVPLPEDDAAGDSVPQAPREPGENVAEASAPGQPADFTRAALLGRLEEATSDLPTAEEQSGVTDAALEAAGIDRDSTSAILSFGGPVPTEIREALEGQADIRMKLRGNQPNGRGEDLMAELGEDGYLELVRSISEDTTSTGRRRAALKAARESGDFNPAAAFDARLYDILSNPEADTDAVQRYAEPSEFEQGDTFTIFGEPFEIVDDADGTRRIESGGLSVPLEGIPSVPVDLGSYLSGLQVDEADLPFSVRRDPNQLTLAGEVEGRATVGDTLALLPDVTQTQSAAEELIGDERLGISAQDMQRAAVFTDAPTPAYARGVADFNAGQKGVRTREGMTFREASDAQRGFRDAKAGASQAQRDDAAPRSEATGEDRETGVLFSVRSDLANLPDIPIASVAPEPYPGESLREQNTAAFNQARDQHAGKAYENRDQRWQIQISAGGLRHSLATGGNPELNRQLLRILPELIENAVWVESNRDKKGQSRRAERLYVPAQVGEDLARVKLTVLRSEDNAGLYDLDGMTIEKGLPSKPERGGTLEGSPSTLSIGDLLGGVKTRQGEDIFDAGVESFDPDSTPRFAVAPPAESQAFRDWFGDSVVTVNGKPGGEPLVVYHGTSSAGFEWFDLYGMSNHGLFGMGGYFTASPTVASSYANKGQGPAQGVYPVYLSIKNPIDMDAEADPEAWKQVFDGVEIYYEPERGNTNETWYKAAEDMIADEMMTRFEGAERLQNGLRQLGYDGVTHVGGGRVNAEGERHRVYVAFDSEQIKSATANVGTYDPDNPDIRFSLRRAPRGLVYSDIGHDTGGLNQLWWLGRRGVETRRPGQITAEQAFGGPADQLVEETHEDVTQVAGSPLAGRVDHDKRLVSLRPGYGFYKNRPIPAASLRSAYRWFAENLPGYQVVEFDMPAEPVGQLSVRRRPAKNDLSLWQSQSQSVGELRPTSQLRRLFTSPGNLPYSTFTAKLRRDGWVNGQVKRTRFLLKDFKAAMSDTYGGSPTPEQLQRIDNVLKGEAEPSTLPESVAVIVGRMRSHIDEMSRKLVHEGVITGELAAHVDENLGLYATRTYQAFTDPKWLKNVPDDVRNRAVSLVRAENPGLTEAEAQDRIKAYLFDKENGPMAALNESKLGSKDLSILKRRKNLSPEFRALLGEIRDPRVSYAESVSKMARLIGNHKLLEDVRREGMGVYLFERPYTQEQDGRTTEFIAQLAADESAVMSPLNGLYTSPDIAKAFEEAVDAQPRENEWLRRYMAANGTVKYAKTVGSVMTHVRNVVGNTGFAAANGHWRFWKAGDAAKLAATDLLGLKDEQLRDRVQQLIELGVVHESVRAGELRDVIRDATKGDPDQFAARSIGGAKRVVDAVTGAAARLYSIEDDVWKYSAFLNERERYRAARPDLGDVELERLAAEIVRKTFPTYSLVPMAVRMSRRFPFLGTFVSFPAEVMRVTGNLVRQIDTELADPRTRRIGIERLVGATVAAGLPLAVATTSRMLLGLDLEDDDAVRAFLPPWQQNSNLLYLGYNDKGQAKVVDLSYTDPYAYVKTPLMALWRGARNDELDQAVVDSTNQLFEPFLGEEILAGKVVDILRNKTSTGGRVWNPADDWDDKSRAAAEHLWAAFEPGTLTSARRIYRGATGYVSPYGRDYDAGVEAFAMFSGFRVQTVDVPQALSFRAKDYQFGSREAKQLLSSVAGRRGEVSDDELRRAYMDSMDADRQAFDMMVKAVSAARALGLSEDEIRRVLETEGVGKTKISEVLAGVYRPYSPTAAFLRSNERRANNGVGAGVDGDEFNRRRELIQELGRDLEVSDAR